MEKIETINQYLADNFGIDTATTQPIYRVVLADDQFEMRLSSYTDTGILMLNPEARLLPKYPWCKGFYVLEQLTITPEVNLKELCGVKVAYNILHKFMGADELPVPPAIWACKFIIDTIRAALGKQSLASYIEKPECISNMNEFYESKKEELNRIADELYGDESSLQGATINSGSAAFVPPNYKKDVN